VPSSPGPFAERGRLPSFRGPGQGSLEERCEAPPSKRKIREFLFSRGRAESLRRRPVLVLVGFQGLQTKRCPPFFSATHACVSHPLDRLDRPPFKNKKMAAPSSPLDPLPFFRSSPHDEPGRGAWAPRAAFFFLLAAPLFSQGGGPVFE